MKKTPRAGEKKDTVKPLASFFLRIGLAIPFLYAAISSFLQPEAWVGYFPAWLRLLIPEIILLTFFSLYELGLAGWLLSNKKPFFAALLSGITLLAITITNLNQLDIVFRDIGLLLAAGALAILHYQKR